MRFARDIAKLPVPKVLHHPPRRRRRYRAGESSGVWYICMEQCPGTSLDKVIDNMTTQELGHVAEQLKVILKCMASIKANSLGSVSGGPYRNFFFPTYTSPKYAFSTTGEFIDHYRQTLLLYSGEAYTETFLSQFPCNAAIRFTHGDLLPKNIIVQGSTITGIIDWYTGGFYPEFWEYCRMHDPYLMTPGWDHVLRQVFPGERRETEIRALRCMMDGFEHNF
ncbi:kinase-like domain-containing protein [Pholiota molesta]|nr:kinase-like domain-containing protein [Pholiota molesta]